MRALFRCLSLAVGFLLLSNAVAASEELEVSSVRVDVDLTLVNEQSLITGIPLIGPYISPPHELLAMVSITIPTEGTTEPRKFQGCAQWVGGESSSPTRGSCTIYDWKQNGSSTAPRALTVDVELLEVDTNSSAYQLLKLATTAGAGIAGDASAWLTIPGIIHGMQNGPDNGRPAARRIGQRSDIIDVANAKGEPLVLKISDRATAHIKTTVKTEKSLWHEEIWLRNAEANAARAGFRASQSIANLIEFDSLLADRKYTAAAECIKQAQDWANDAEQAHELVARVGKDIRKAANAAGTEKAAGLLDRVKDLTDGAKAAERVAVSAIARARAKAADAAIKEERGAFDSLHRAIAARKAAAKAEGEAEVAATEAEELCAQRVQSIGDSVLSAIRDAEKKAREACTAASNAASAATVAARDASDAANAVLLIAGDDPTLHEKAKFHATLASKEEESALQAFESARSMLNAVKNAHTEARRRVREVNVDGYTGEGSR